MTIAGLLIFAAVYAAAVASPGPGIAAIVARALGHGLAGMPYFIAGFVLGDLTLFSIAATGLAVIVQAYAGVVSGLKFAGAAYLLFLAWKLWQGAANPADPAAMGQTPGNPLQLFLASYSLTVGNPKAIIFFMAILPTIVDLKAISPGAILEIAAVIALAMPCVLVGYALAADRARRLFTSASSIRTLNRATAVIMAGAAAAVAHA